ncbi:prepilin peptidase [Mariniplasma anaerobium]|uniref:Prepilin peptidase n=1 Tax=Mariniplasma anaerobium TaxID=2735436 RepID=A0A7U9TGZ7_9MOLU|nr:A24 family peptidase [Mariniplasma anaerobium]BCR35582.1 prepilin peptidase [Mariniplasma anaerobium]
MTILYAIFIFIFGSLFTSFFHVLAVRIPKGETLLGTSHCDHCERKLRLVDVLPIIGFVINKGKCHNCGVKIGVKHLIYEIIGGSLFTLSFLLYGFTIDFYILIILLSVLLIESIVDIDSMIVIDRIWMIGIIPILLIRILDQEIWPYILSSAVLFVLLFLIATLAKAYYKKDALGAGDVKLYIFIGLFLKFPQGVLSLFLASLFGLIYGIIFMKEKDKYLPLVPFISLSVYICYLYGEQMIDWYLKLLGM